MIYIKTSVRCVGIYFLGKIFRVGLDDKFQLQDFAYPLPNAFTDVAILLIYKKFNTVVF